MPGLAELAASQYAVVSRRQLAAVGVTAVDVSRQVRARRWRAVGPLVVADQLARATDAMRDIDNLAAGCPTLRVTPWALRHRRPELVPRLVTLRLAAEARLLP